jgi:alkylhydroperoxidase/carboxymuconolactone decarboxylase family protein YurZ
LNKILPKVAEIFVKIRRAIITEKVLDLKIKELVAVILYVLTIHQFCIDEYSYRAMNQKIIREEVAEAIMLTMFIAEGSQLYWENAHDKNLYELVFEGDNLKKKEIAAIVYLKTAGNRLTSHLTNQLQNIFSI